MSKDSRWERFVAFLSDAARLLVAVLLAVYLDDWFRDWGIALDAFQEVLLDLSGAVVGGLLAGLIIAFLLARSVVTISWSSRATGNEIDGSSITIYGNRVDSPAELFECKAAIRTRGLGRVFFFFLASRGESLRLAVQSGEHIFFSRERPGEISQDQHTAYLALAARQLPVAGADWGGIQWAISADEPFNDLTSTIYYSLEKGKKPFLLSVVFKLTHAVDKIHIKDSPSNV